MSIFSSILSYFGFASVPSSKVEGRRQKHRNSLKMRWKRNLSQQTGGEPSLVEYDKDVRYMIEKKLDFVFPNWSSGHAAVVISNMAESALLSGDLLMYEPRLNDDIADERLRNALDRMVSSGNGLRLVLRFFEPADCETRIFKTIIDLWQRFPDRVSLTRDSNGVFADRTRCEFGQSCYFAVRDRFVRIENFSENNHFSAVCNANNQELAAKLRTVFSDSIDNADTLLPPIDR